METKYIKYVKGRLRVEFEHIGEGWNGDFDPGDSDDEKLLRFDISKKIGRSWEPIDDSSYCTCLSINTPRELLRKYLEFIFNAVKDDVNSGNSIKKICEWLSWIGYGGGPCRPNIKDKSVQE